MPVVNMLEAKSSLSRLVEAVESGAETEIIIARNGRPAARLALARSGPHDMPISAQHALGYFHDAGYALLDIVPAHVVAAEQLPRLHADPFGRMLVGQALTVPLRLITHDA